MNNLAHMLTLLRTGLRFMALFSLLMIFFFAAIPASANVRRLTDVEWVGMSDVIVVGTVEEIVDETKTQSQHVVKKSTDIAIVRVQRILKGQPAALIDVCYLPVPVGDTPGGVKAGMRRLFFLQRLRDRYLLPHGAPSMHSVDEADSIAELVKTFPLDVRIATITPIWYFGQESILNVTITNSGKEPIGVSQITLHGFFCSPAMELRLPEGAEFPISGIHRDTTQSQQIEPGQTYTARIPYCSFIPKSWAGYRPDSYLLTQARVRVKATIIDKEFQRTHPDMTYTIVSPLLNILVGFPPPENDGSNAEKVKE